MSYSTDSRKIPFDKKLSMAILATLPMLAWYAIPFPVGLGYALVLFLSVYTIVKNRFKINVLPITFWLVFIYISIMWMYNNKFALGALFPPGGWQFFIFTLSLLWGITKFDIHLLRKYMRWVILISAALFWVQYISKMATGSNPFCFVPNLTGSFTYEKLTYADLVALHKISTRPCSIFLEPSYMAYYYITYLAIVWFNEDNQKKWINKEIALILLSLIALKSGSGMVGLAILFITKMFTSFWNTNIKQRFTLVMIIVPLIIGVTYMYISSEMGQEMSSRSTELSTEGTSGFTRVVGGYMMFEQLNFDEQVTGISGFRKRFGIELRDGRLHFFANGVQTILLSLGYIGALLYLLFYTSLFRKTSFTSRMCIIVLLVMALLESNYLNPYMMLLTIIPCAEYYKMKSIQL